MHRYRLDVVNSKFSRGMVTYSKNTKGKKSCSIIDYAISNNTNTFVENFVINQNRKFKAHKPIICKMKLNKVNISEIDPIYNFGSFSSSNPQLLLDNKNMINSKLKILNKMINLLDLKPTQTNKSVISDILSYLIYYLLMKAMITVFGIKRVNSFDEWHNTNVDIAALNAEIKLNLPDDDRLKVLTTKYNKCINDLKQKQIDDNTNKIINYRSHNKEKFLKKLFLANNQQSIVQNIRYKNQFFPKNIAHRLYHQDIMQDSNIVYDEPTRNILNNLHNTLDNNSNFTIYTSKLIKDAVNSTNPVGAAGYDRISQTHLTDLGDPICKLLTVMYNVWSATNKIPSFIKMGVITSLPKSNAPTSPDEYRPITLLPVVYKVFERLILWQLNDANVEQNIHILQGGFRKERGVLEQLGTLRILSEHAKKHKEPLYAICLDIRKAYDTVRRDAILIKLQDQFNVPISTISIIRDMLCNTSSAINDNHHIYNPFNTTLGVVQGSVISPILYGIFINDLIIKLDDSNLGSHIFNHHIPCLLSCDDIILTSNCMENIHQLLSICEQHSLQWNYKFNIKKCNLITHNVHEPIQEIITFSTKDHHVSISNEFHNQIPFYYKNNSLVTITSTPLVLTHYYSNTQYVKGYDLQGIRRYWSINVFHKKLRNTIISFFTLHNDDSNIQFLIYWNHLPISSPIDKFKSSSFIYNKKIKYKSICRYLGAKLYDKDDHCLISETKTNKNFIKRMFAREHQLLHNLHLNYTKIHLNIKLPLIKSFFLAYTEIFAQILPTHHFQNLDQISFRSQTKLCQIYHKRTNINQFRMFIGIPSPSQRWIVIKLLHYYKIMLNPNHTIYNMLINNLISEDLPTFNYLRKLINTWIPDITMNDIKYNDELSLDTYRSKIIKRISKYNLSKLHIYHPFKVIKFITNSYTPFYITNIDLISTHYPHIKKTHLKNYYELFYNFGWFTRKSHHKKFCKICHHRHA